MSEHDFEPIRGLPGVLPPGEKILWQGAPNWLALAEQAFHLRAIAAYFAAMLVWRVGQAWIDGEAPAAAVANALWVTPLALVALGVLAGLGWLNARTTVYTITNRRVVLRFGAALPKAINIPFGIIEGGATKALSGGRGDLALKLKAPNKIALLHLWPHARPWRITAPEPTLRAIPDAQAVATILTAALSAQIPIDRLRTAAVTPDYDGVLAPAAAQTAAA